MLAAVVMAACLLPSAFSLPPADSASIDAVTIRRILIDPARPPVEIQQEKEWVAVPRPRFEEIAQKAEKLAGAVGNPPRLLETRYEAALRDGQLVGTGVWKLHNPSEVAAMLRLDLLGLALRGRPKLDDVPAIAGDADAGYLVLVPPGHHQLTFPWSTRAEPDPKGLAFSLPASAASVAVLELLLPADQILTLPDTRQLTPVILPASPSDPPATRRWLVAFGGREQRLSLLVRPVRDTGKPPLVVVRPQSDYRIDADGIEARFELNLECAHGRVTDLYLDCPVDLQPVEVIQQLKSPQAASWRLIHEGGRQTLVVTLGQPLEERTTLEVHCRVLPLPALLGALPVAQVAGRPVGTGLALGVTASGSRLSFPGLRLRGGLPGPETIRMRTGPDALLTNWDFGDFHPSGPYASHREAGELVETLTLVQEAIGGKEGPRRPSAVWTPNASNLTVQQESWWQINLQNPTLTVRLWWQVRTGRLDRLRLRLPAGWQVDDIDLSPLDGAMDWSLRREGADSSILVAEYLKGSLGPQTPVKMTIRLRPIAREHTPLVANRLKGAFGSWVHRLLALRSSSAAATLEPGSQLPIPLVIPLDARWLDAGLAISLPRGKAPHDRLFVAAIERLNARQGPPPSAPGQLWGNQAPDLYFTYHGRQPRASLKLEPLPPELRTQITTEVFVGNGPGRIVYSVRAEPVAGSPRSIRLASSGKLPDLAWEVVSSSQARHVVAKPGPTGESNSIQLDFQEPLQEPILLRAESTVETGQAPVVPLLRSEDPGYWEGHLLLYLEPGYSAEVAGEGLEPSEPSFRLGARDVPVWRAYRYGAEAPSVTVKATPAGPSHPLVKTAVLTSYADPSGGVYSQYRCRVLNPQGTSLVLQLPAAAEPCSLRIEGRTAPMPECVAGKLTLPAIKGMVDYELSYRESSSPWKVVGRLQASVPQWDGDVRVLESRHYWRLPRDMVPLPFSALRRVPEPVPADTPSRWSVVGTFQRYATHLWQAQPPPVSEEIRNRLESEIDKWHRAPNPEPLGLFLVRLERLAGDPQLVLVVDQAALADAKISLVGTSSLGRPDLALVYGRGVILVTSQQQLSSWRFQNEAELEHRLGPVLREAIAHGHDVTGRFRTLEESPPYLEDHGGLEGGTWPVDAGASTGWTTWELVEDSSGASLWLVHRQVAHPLGMLVALGVLAAGFWLGVRPRRLFVFLTASFLAAVILLLWLPEDFRPLGWWPLAATAWLALGWILRGTPWTRTRKPLSSIRTRGAVGSIVLSVIWLGQHVQARRIAEENKPEPITVYLIPATVDAPDRETVLAPRSAWLKLQELAGGTPALPPYLLVEAEYQGKSQNDAVLMEAAYEVYLTKDGQVSVVLPIGNARLRQAQLDSAPVLATPTRQPEGFSFRVEGKGLHRLQLVWETPLRQRPGEHELRGAIPPVTASRLHLELAGQGKAVAVQSARGGQWLQEPSAENPRRLLVDLGRVPELAVRWRTDEATAGTVQVQELYLADLRGQEAMLYAALRYEVKNGAAAQLRLQLPAGLDVKSLELHGQPSQPPPRLRDWSLTTEGGQRQLLLTLAYPVEGKFRVHLEMPINLAVLTESPPNVRTLRLPLPAPLGATRSGAMLAYRVSNLEMDILPRGWNSASAEDFLTLWPQDYEGLRQKSDLKAVFRAPLRGPAPPHQLTLRSESRKFHVTQQVTLALDSPESEVRADVSVTAQSGRIVYLEWQVAPDLMVVDVQGPDLDRWNRQGGAVQLWFKRPVADKTSLTLSGWLGSKRDASRREVLALPQMGFAGAATQTTRLDLHRRGPLTIQPMALKALRELAGPRRGVEEMASFLTSSPDYAGQLRLVPTGGDLDAFMVTTLAGPATMLRYQTAIAIQSLSRPPRSVTLHVRGWKSDEPLRVEGKGVTSRATKTGEETWEYALEWANPQEQLRRFVLLGELAAKTGQRLTLPEIELVGARSSKRHLAPLPFGLAPVNPPSLPRPEEDGWIRWPSLPPGQFVELQALSASPSRTKPRVFLAEYETWLSPTGRASHQVQYTVLHGAGADLRIRVPEETLVVGVTLDGNDVGWMTSGPSTLIVPLPAASGWCRVRLRWTVNGSNLSDGHYRLRAPLVEGTAEIPALWRLHRPESFVTSSPEPSDRNNAAWHEVRRAEELLKMMQSLAGRWKTGDSTAPMARAQEAFYQALRRAERHLRVARSSADGQASSRLLALQNENQRIFRDTRWEPIRKKAEESSGSDPASALEMTDPIPGGTPLYFSYTQPPEELTLPLAAQASVRNRQALGATLLFAVLALGALAAARSARAIRLAQIAWPELLVFAGLLWWVCLPLPGLGILLVLVGVASRLILLARWLAWPSSSEELLPAAGSTPAVSIGSSS